MKTYENFDILVYRSEGFWETLMKGKYKAAGMVVSVVTPGTGRNVKSIMQLTGRGMVITQELHQFLQNGTPIQITLKSKQSDEQTANEFRQILGNSWFRGHHYTFASAMGKLFGIENYKALTIDDILKEGGHVVEGSY